MQDLLIISKSFCSIIDFSITMEICLSKGIFLVIVVYKRSCNFCEGINDPCFFLILHFYCCIFNFYANLVKLQNYYLYILLIPANKYITAMQINFEGLCEKLKPFDVFAQTWTSTDLNR